MDISQSMERKSKHKSRKEKEYGKRGVDAEQDFTEGVDNHHTVAVVVVVYNRQEDQAVDHHIPCRGVLCLYYEI
jgi:hypothetical protein